jgi:adenine phosphoribosyltransferase
LSGRFPISPPGILFRDITTLIAHGEGLPPRRSPGRPRAAAAALIAGMEARGFIFGAAVAARAWAWASCRCASRASCRSRRSASIMRWNMARPAGNRSHGIRPGQRVVIVDDLIATGGTALAAAELLRQAGAAVRHALFVIDLPDLHGAERLRGAGVTVDALMDFRALKRESPALRRERGLCALPPIPAVNRPASARRAPRRLRPPGAGSPD